MLYLFYNKEGFFMVKKKEVAKLCNKNILSLGIFITFAGIIIGIVMMSYGLLKLDYYQNNYTEEKKLEYERSISLVDTELENIEQIAEELEIQKKLLQEELNEIYAEEGYNERYYEKEEELTQNENEKIKNDNLKYERIATKNELKKELNEITENLDFNDNRLIYVLPGFLATIVFIIIGFIVISASYTKDKDELALHSTPDGPLQTIDQIEKSNKNQNKNDDIKLPSYRKDKEKESTK